jgi:U3 small nucleolar RNA-associated protein 18
MPLIDLKCELDFENIFAQLNSSLKTAVDGIHFNHNGELLLVSSSKVKDAVRVINIATANTIPHWPTSQTPLGYVFCSDINPESTELALGNARGRVLIYNLLSYHKRENI